MMQSKYAIAVALLSLTSCNAFLSPSLSTSSTRLFANNDIASSGNNDSIRQDNEDLFTAAVTNGYYVPPKGVQFAGIRRTNRNTGMSSTQLSMADRNALIPDGGLSPCVIKVVGVGGGGCNAVSLHLLSRCG